MRLGLLSTLAVLLTGAGLVLGQAPPPAAAPATIINRPAPSALTETIAQAPAPAPGVAPVPPAPPGGPAALVPTELTGPPVEESAPYDPQLYQVWGSVEALLWRFGGTVFPNLTTQLPAGTVTVLARNIVTTGAPPVTSTLTSNTFNVLVNATVVPPGGNGVLFNDQPGMRLNLGYWVDPQQELGYDASYFWIWRRTVSFSNNTVINGQAIDSGIDQTVTATSTGVGATSQVVLTQPVFIVANTATSMVGFAQNQLWGAEVNSRTRLAYFGPSTFDFFGGFRYIDAEQVIGSNQTIALTPSGAGQVDPGAASGNLVAGAATIPAPGVFATVQNNIKAHNQIWGVQFGTTIDWYLGPRVFALFVGKLGFGDNYQTFELSAANGVATSGPIVSNGDAGTTQHSHRFIFFPEMDLNLGFQITPYLRIYGGYNIIYLSAVARVSNQIQSTTSNTTVTFGNTSPQAQSTVIPGFKVSTTDSSIQGFNLALEYRY